MDRYRKALQAYKEAMTAPLSESESGWTPPPTSGFKDKKWSQELRKMWPDYASVRLHNSKESVSARTWCEENDVFYWSSTSDLVWYFSKRDIAVAFKLIFKGEIE